jgi:hypothetical protein
LVILSSKIKPPHTKLERNKNCKKPWNFLRKEKGKGLRKSPVN